MSNVELKPCHVCGATSGLYVLEDYKDLEWYVFCDNCKTSVHSEYALTKEEAIEVWNTRFNHMCQNLYNFETDSKFFECSRCDYCDYETDRSDWNYCPQCGAKIEQ